MDSSRDSVSKCDRERPRTRTATSFLPKMIFGANWTNSGPTGPPIPGQMHFQFRSNGPYVCNLQTQNGLPEFFPGSPGTHPQNPAWRLKCDLGCSSQPSFTRAGGQDDVSSRQTLANKAYQVAMGRHHSMGSIIRFYSRNFGLHFGRHLGPNNFFQHHGYPGIS